MLLVGQVEARATALGAALAPHVKDGWLVVNEMREEFDANLNANPLPESPAAQLMRKWGL